jgi:hypothetical protein
VETDLKVINQWEKYRENPWTEPDRPEGWDPEDEVSQTRSLWSPGVRMMYNI